MRYGYTVLCPQLHLPRFYRETVAGLELIRAELPRENSRTLTRCAAVMERYGVKRMLEGRLPGYATVPTADLWQAHSSALALRLLASRNLPPERAVVALSATHVNRRVLTATEELSDQVWAVALEIPHASWLELWLQQRNGVPVLRSGGDLTLCFSPGITKEGAVELGARQPQVPGWGLEAKGVEVPQGCPVEPVLSLLVEGGALTESEIEVVSVGLSR